MNNTDYTINDDNTVREETFFNNIMDDYSNNDDNTVREETFFNNVN